MTPDPRCRLRLTLADESKSQLCRDRDEALRVLAETRETERVVRAVVERLNGTSEVIDD